MPATAPARVVIGVDVARFGRDRSVITVRRGNVVEDIQVYPYIDTMALAGRVVVAVRERNPDRVNVDEIGLGSGVVDRLQEQGIPVHGFNAALPPVRETACANRRAEGYWLLRQRFSHRNIRIPHDPELMAELSALRYTFNSSGKMLMESKDDIRKRGLPSPDKADALMLAFWEDASTLHLL